MRKTLLVIDMINDFIDPAGTLYCGETARRIVPVVASLIEHFDREGHSIIFLCDAHQEDDEEFQLFRPHAVRGSRGARIIPELQVPPGAVVMEKTRFSAFHETDLGLTLAEQKPDEVWVSGVCTSICVMDTVGDLRNRGYQPVVVENAVADFDAQFHDFALVRMERVYGARRIKWGES